jgi:4-hydroxy-tetrahydrodipicolinate synthase
MCSPRSIVTHGSAMNERIRGVLAPVVTPFGADLKPDAGRLKRHCRWLLTQSVGLAVFGTNSEANSLSVDERISLLDQLIDDGIPPYRMMPGTGCCAISDSIRLTAHAVRHGVAGCLMLPPFYYKGVTDEGLYRNFAAIIDGVSDARLRIYLYHIPPVAQVGISLGLIERLLRDFPGVIAGIKDSSGDWNNTRAVLGQFAASGFDVFAGSESFLLANLRHGGVGCISATANVNPAPIDRLYREWRSTGADALQGELDAVRAIFQKRPMIAALKASIAHWSKDHEWARVRPPLVELSPSQTSELIADLDACAFEMPGIAQP